jgi:hypothetical protein
MATTKTRLEYEVSQDATDRLGETWAVAAVNHAGDGEIYVATFDGPDAKERAEEYAAFKNGQ